MAATDAFCICQAECYFPDVIYIHETESVGDQKCGHLLLTAMETSLLTVYISVSFSGGSAAQEMKRPLVTCWSCCSQSGCSVRITDVICAAFYKYNTLCVCVCVRVCVFQAYSLVDREVGYCQGSAFIVGLLLMQVMLKYFRIYNELFFPQKFSALCNPL